MHSMEPQPRRDGMIRNGTKAHPVRFINMLQGVLRMQSS